ncbi:hypothetical protein ABFS82_10G029700 [Erythranthe guttata]|uniref:Nucleotide exchange factor Fes1 domain-containing protein n=1 Tax=Erythranthe guttata TaxID=4155 RepID=A0A022RNV4_ERYGU|nr:PREDICTED: uncharacterized protein LOC105952972 [Erythranthe guttata]EYU41749.1 hypothetical protein MIMGU_mgv1a008476mg [Erythranthe guttata]|eukprot:XP_012832030.1 PREDICTED: uncharacterized protein LOC105952972 [Erythranthe guttata]
MAGEGPNWQGLLKWSLSHADGSNPSRNLSEADKKWFKEAMEAQTVDIVKRMKEITLVMKTSKEDLESQGVTDQDIQDMLDELQEHVECIDMANDLHKIGGLTPLLGYLEHSNSKIRAKAAEVITTIVQNNPTSQNVVMAQHGLKSLDKIFTSDTDIVACTKALGAISSLIRNNKIATEEFIRDNGYEKLRDALTDENVRFQRKALNLMSYLLDVDKSRREFVLEAVSSSHLASSSDGGVREAVLSILLDMARDKSGSGKAAKKFSKEKEKYMKKVLQERVKRITEMSEEDLVAAKEEIRLVEELWRVCFCGPSPLVKKGIAVLDGENELSELPPDVASKHFEPPLRAWAAANMDSEKKDEAPLLIGPQKNSM